MKALIQRVSEACVRIDGVSIGAIGQGLVVLLGVERRDDQAIADKMLERLLAYRLFADDNGKMNLSVTEVNGEILLVSQFTLAADTRKGLRPGFSTAAEPAVAEALYNRLAKGIAAKGVTVATGRFAADMKVSLVNDGPVTFMLEV